MPRTAEFLVKMGNDIAQRFLRESVSMTESLAAVRATHSLNDEETRRVAENANRAAFVNLFHQAPMADKAVSFQLADANSLVGKEQSLDKAASYTEGRTGNVGFYRPRTQGFHKSKYDSSEVDAYFEKAASLVKTASAPVGDSPDVQWLRSKREYEAARQKKTLADIEYGAQKQVFLKEARLALKSEPLQHVLEALLPYTPDGNAEALSEMGVEVERARSGGFLKEAAFHSYQPVVDEGHPLVEAYVRLVKVAELRETASTDEVKARAKMDRLHQEVVRAHTS